ncbi:ABC-type transport system involved in cytochrome c biogenesis, permease component [Schinkia azotoformans MEV2011]|uniref:Heme exporter protein B n=1 Tax=Schinkia azotoformans MEV2011 TaxID=1348973 RepID=A0A072NPE9_SCHAZ|nr:heme exporter protein CcmB [Schinkia azotoformans]KEF39361.1 ABC-type transport system involved in cytochrome c biogenesis, permease component [Schinkia azotoformans MEV2011]MEC1694887.1 heme exporter protein CcmB [Schinkia azotoformans]MEC1715669.1 heme exporter protein CcmB [Schinkia azotoformans]MEC1726721.1 heme exporter protein CcmB [Schinkia azotoformans]MEC1742211.1 heme exporter protein CcmB [Schinkia azotoformans]
MGKILKTALVITSKDLYSEWKTKQIISTMLIFSALVIVTFSFAFDPANNTVKAVIPGMIWVITIFSGILGLNRSFLGEQANDSLNGLIVAPVDPSSVYLGKFLSNFLLVILVQIVAVPLLFILFDFKILGHISLLIIVLLLGTFGFISVGTFLAALSANSKSSEMLLPIILFPVVSPVLIGAVQATKIILINFENIASAFSWMKLMAAYDLVFFVICFILFEYVLEV